MKNSPERRQPVGYIYLIQKFNLNVIPNWHQSWIRREGKIVNKQCDNFEETTYPFSYWPGDSLGSQLEFAIKYDGINLCILSVLFSAIDKNDLILWIKNKPNSKYTRKVWFLYEYLMNSFLPIESLIQGNYIQLLNPKLYFVLENGERIRRQRVINNMLGVQSFSPIVRKTSELSKIDLDLNGMCKDITSKTHPEILNRAMQYMFTKETKASFALENEKPTTSRTEKFVSLLKMAWSQDFCTEEGLLAIQNKIVDERFRDIGIRKNQNYVGQSTSLFGQIVHYVSPKPNDLPSLFRGLIETHRKLLSSKSPPILHAAIIAYGFVFLHPFEDGNGRIHRFLLHNILAIRKAVPKNFIFPISATMINNKDSYDKSLESFSIPLMQVIDYDLDQLGCLEVKNDTSIYYRYMDMTNQVEALLNFVEETMSGELLNEIAFLQSYDATKVAIQKIVDLPDQKIDLFIKFTIQNNYKISKNKRKLYCDMLTDNEICLMEREVKEKFSLTL